MYCRKNYIVFDVTTNSTTRFVRKNEPESYKKTTNIEKLVLLYASNFIEQFKTKYPNRRQLVLIHENECGIQVRQLVLTIEHSSYINVSLQL